ncbi:MAG: hypothetical protein ACREPQ_14750 [Rhodanobacter sp.]
MNKQIFLHLLAIALLLPLFIHPSELSPWKVIWLCFGAPCLFALAVHLYQGPSEGT